MVVNDHPNREAMTLQLGRHCIDPALVLAPMAGVTDKPFRQLCRRLGAGLAPSEMLTADPGLWETPKSRARMDHSGEPGPISVQIAGYDPAMLANAARHNVAHGADIVDINMGCPAKKVCKRDAGSALMKDEALVARILSAVVDAVDVPVTLKTRTGWAAGHRNAVRIARIAEDSGIAAIAIHGRTRDQKYAGQAEYETIRSVKQAVGIPVLANGDIDSPEKALQVLEATRADGLLIGRAAQGRPWIFREIDHFLRTGEHLPSPDARQISAWLTEHLDGIYRLYGEYRGVRIARKHIGWYVADQPARAAFLKQAMRLESADAQLVAVRRYFEGEAHPARDSVGQAA